MLSFSIASFAVVVATLYFLSLLAKYLRNWYYAVSIGLPYISVPFDQNAFLWMMVSVPLRPVLQRYLPETVFNKITLCIYGWEPHQKMHPFETYAASHGNDKSFMLFGTGKLELWTRDPEICREILSRPRDFTQLDISNALMGIFGRNVLTADGEVWSRHRRIVASAITERVISGPVWREAAKLTKDMLEEITETAGKKLDDGSVVIETRRTFDLMKKITIHVLSTAGLGIKQDWMNEANERPKPGFQMTYIDAVKCVIENAAGPMMIPNKVLSNWPRWMPGVESMRNLGIAKQEFPVHTKEALTQEKETAAKQVDGETRNNVMSMLIAASERGTEDEEKGSVRRKGPALSDDEIVGNLFIFTAAGFDTTSNTLSYALALLARYPEWQEWLFEEVDSLQTDGTNELDYTATFPKAIRTLAIMLETLRLFPPIIHATKMTQSEQIIKRSSGKDIVLPKDSTVYVDNIALQLDPEVWRDLNISAAEKEGQQSGKVLPVDKRGQRYGDEWYFRPTRWINPPGSSQPLFQPPRGTFNPWSMGPRVCPGQRMAQVEFTAIFLTLFQHYRMEPVKLMKQEVIETEGRKQTVRQREETDQEIEARLIRLTKDSISKLTLEMDVYDVGKDADVARSAKADARGLNLRWIKRNEMQQ